MGKLKKKIFLPQNYIAEETLIGIALLYPSILKTLKGNMKGEYFFLEKNRIIYLSLQGIARSSKTIELLYELESKKLLRKVGGIESIIEIMKQGQVFICKYRLCKYTIELIQLLRDNYVRRLIIQFGHTLVKIGHIKNISNKYLYEKTLLYINKIEEIINKSSETRVVSIKDLFSQKLINLKYNKTYIDHSKNRYLIKSGINSIDKIIGTLPDGNLIIIAGRPSIGKTTLAINIAYNAFIQQQINLLIFSLEMSSDEILNKFISISLEKNFQLEETEELNNKKWYKMGNICNQLLTKNIYINDKSNLDIQYIENLSNNIKKNKIFI